MTNEELLDAYDLMVHSGMPTSALRYRNEILSRMLTPEQIAANHELARRVHDLKEYSTKLAGGDYEVPWYVMEAAFAAFQHRKEVYAKG